MQRQNEIKQILAENGITQRQLAKQIGVSDGAISAYFNGNYKGNTEALEQALQRWLESREKKTDVFVEAPDFIETPTAVDVCNALDLARWQGTIATVFGSSGVGKTKAAKEYVKQNRNVWLITASPARSSLNAILYEMALELGINDAPRRKDRLSRMIQTKLKGTKGLMIVDESDHLPYDALEEIRYLQEECEVGFALIGNDKVYTRIQGGVNPAHEYARLWSRVGAKCPIKANKKGDIKAVAKAWGLDISDKELMTALYDIGGRAGGLRALTQYLRLAGMSAKGSGTAITLELILMAKQQMQGGK